MNNNNNSQAKSDLAPRSSSFPLRRIMNQRNDGSSEQENPLLNPTNGLFNMHIPMIRRGSNADVIAILDMALEIVEGTDEIFNAAPPSDRRSRTSGDDSRPQQ